MNLFFANGIRWLGVFLFFSLYLEAHTPKAYLREQKHLTCVPVLTLHEKPCKTSPYETQVIYGTQIYLIRDLEDGWALVETEGGYQGYATRSDLCPDLPVWRTHKQLHRTSSIATLIYPGSDTKDPAWMRLPLGSYIVLIDPFEENDQRWLRVHLIDGRIGWVQRGDIEPIEPYTFETLPQLAQKFLGLPYIWGGTSSEGFDCSGYIQTLFSKAGRCLPRNSRQQAASPWVEPIAEATLPGDLLFFGVERITHVGMYLGEDLMIHTGVVENRPYTNITRVSTFPRQVLSSGRVVNPEYRFSIQPISDEIFARMQYSWRNDNPVPLSELRYLQMSHFGFDGCVHEGEMIVHQKLAEEVVEIFEELFAVKYPLEKMLLIDEYAADDDRSCMDNNTSCFCSRSITGDARRWSLHSYGVAIDVNPYLNPYHNLAYRSEGIIGEEFLDRALECRGMIQEGDPCYRAFVSRGWEWGGDWQKTKGYVDYQHFEKRSVLND